MRCDDEVLLAQILRDGIGTVEDLGERVKVARDERRQVVYCPECGWEAG